MSAVYWKEEKIKKKRSGMAHFLKKLANILNYQGKREVSESF